MTVTGSCLERPLATKIMGSECTGLADQRFAASISVMELPGNDY
jgi:hypothetical protein